jgi:hypothetical protein
MLYNSDDGYCILTLQLLHGVINKPYELQHTWFFPQAGIVPYVA